MASTLEPAPIRTHRFTRERYERRVQAGIFGASDRVERYEDMRGLTAGEQIRWSGHDIGVGDLLP